MRLPFSSLTSDWHVILIGMMFKPIHHLTPCHFANGCGPICHPRHLHFQANNSWKFPVFPAKNSGFVALIVLISMI